jgi:lactoylglutathione lyase
MNIHYAIVYVSDMDAAVAFYRDVLGLTLRFQSPGWTELATDGATLALHAARAPAPQGAQQRAGTVRIGFDVDDLAAFHARMLAHGVACAQEPKLQFGAKLAEYVGPDGMVFSVGERRGG